MVIFKEAQDSWYKKLLSKREFTQFVADSLAGNFKDDRKAWIGNVTPEASARIRNVCGKSVSKIMVSSSAIVHAYSKQHHNLLMTDILHIVEVINSVTDIKQSTGRSKSEPTAPVLEFEVDIDGSIKFIELVRISRKYNGWIDLVTCYRYKKRKAAKDT